MISKLLKNIYPIIYVNIVVGLHKTKVYIEVVSRNKVIDYAANSFKTLSINEKMLAFILSYTSDSPYFYISLLDKSSSQGAIGSCSKKLMSKYYDLENSKYMCTKDKWAYYTSSYDLQKSENRYKEIGLDFIFSPFLVLSLFFKNKIDSRFAMYILIEETFLSLCVFNNGKLLFAIQLGMEHKHSDESDLLVDSESEEDNFTLDDIDIEESKTDFLEDDFSNIEDLSNIDEFVEFKDDKDVNTKETQENIVKVSSSSGFNEDYQRFTLIQNAVNSYYKDDRYESEFIENVYIADNIRVSRDLKKYLEEEMFLKVAIRNIDLTAEICELAKAEI
jgi:hypothetical protein